jgi:hypothetical protein
LGSGVTGDTRGTEHLSGAHGGVRAEGSRGTEGHAKWNTECVKRRGLAALREILPGGALRGREPPSRAWRSAALQRPSAPEERLAEQSPWLGFLARPLRGYKRHFHGKIEMFLQVWKLSNTGKVAFHISVELTPGSLCGGRFQTD